MSALRFTVTILACLFLASACAPQEMEVFAEEPDGAVSSVADADLVDVSDASAPVASDAAVESQDDLPIELACSLDDVQPILECVTDNCLDSIADNTLLTCVTLSCGLLLLTLPPDCSQCILTGLSDPSSALDACVSGLEGVGGGFPLPPAP